MLRVLALLVAMSPIAAVAQTAADAPSAGMNHQMMDHSKNHAQMTREVPAEPGQSAFAAIQEIVGILEADANTDWAKVNIDALRAHLVDMNAVTLDATVSSAVVENGITFTITGGEPTRGSIRRMVMAHAATTSGANDWQFTATETDTGAMMTVIAPPADREKLKALGFFGILTLGMHHQEHHFMIARGGSPHH